MDLFEYQAEVEPRARASDPPTSHAAAERHRRAGRDRTNKARVLAGVQQYPNQTSKELAELIDMERHEVARRLSDLEGEGKVRKSGSALYGVMWEEVPPPKKEQEEQDNGHE